MKDVMGIIYTGEKDSFLRELTLQRAIAAVPVAGRYRVIDFFVSAMVNSGVRNVGGAITGVVGVAGNAAFAANPGYTYTIQYFKPGSFGPNTTEVTVP